MLPTSVVSWVHGNRFLPAISRLFCRYIKYVARYIFIRSFLLYLHGFLFSDKTAPPAFALAINGI
jgi:hypothetical protein